MQMARVSAVILAGLMMAFGARSAAADEAALYELKVAIEPAAGTVSVRGSIAIPMQADAPQITFGLHRTFVIKKLAVNGKNAAFTYQPIDPTPMNPAARNVVVRLPTGAVRDGTVRMEIAYGGRLEELPEWGSAPDLKWAMDDQVNGRLVELANYSSWYPQFFPFGHALQIDLEVSLPKGWTAVSSGTKSDTRSSNDRAVTRWVSPRNTDIVISASPNFRRVAGRASGDAIEIYHTQMPDSVVAREVTDLTAVMTMFSDRLGETTVPGGTVRHVYSPMKHGQGRAGIARLGLIVTSEGRVLEAMAKKPDYTLFQDIVHEIGHFWWNFGAGQGDWINEAFAEYFSALAVRDIVSQQQFEAVLEKYRKQVARLPPDTPSLATVSSGGSAFLVRYYKGALMLDELRLSMGDDAFFQAARDFFQTYRSQPTGTAEFRAFWGARLGDKKTRLDAWLDTGGGLPAQ